MDPTYTPSNTNPAYQLNWGLTVFWREAPIAAENWLTDLQRVTKPDGVRILRHRSTTGGASQFFVSTKPNVAPSELIRSVKGRLQYVIRSQSAKAFQRNYCLRSVGDATRKAVEDYVSTQLGHHRMADPKVQKQLARYQKTFPLIDLSALSFSSHGEYWHNLHLVIVNEVRWMETRADVLDGPCNVVEKAAIKHGYQLSTIGLLPDHLHLTMGCPIDCSPQDVALGYLNNCAFVYGMKPVYKFSYYVGTIGEYDRGAIA